MGSEAAVPARATWLPMAALELFEQMEDSVAVYDRQARFIYVNASTERLFGRPRAELLGRVLWELFPEAVGNPFHQAFQRVLANGSAESFDHEYQPWGRIFSNYIYPWGQGLCVFARDITVETRAARDVEAARRQAEKALAVAGTALDRLRILARVSRVITEEPLDVPSVCRAVAHQVAEEIGDACGVYLLVEGSDLIETLALHDNRAEALEVLKLLSSAHPARLDDGLIGKVMRTGKSLMIPVVDHERLMSALMAEYRDYVARFPVRSLLIAPMSHAGRVLGAMVLVRHDPARPYERADVDLVEDLGGRAALAVIRARERQELDDARRRAQEANRAKDEFLAMLGHELRNPLAPMQTALELMQMRSPSAAEKERVVIERQMKHMVRLVDDLLDVSRITGGKVILRRGPIELGEVVAKAVEVASHLLEQRAQTLTSELPASGLLVLADQERLTQVVSNLLTNASKYSERGGRIELAAHREGDQAVLLVRDNGMGIDPELLPSIFQLFVQGRQAIDRSEGGLGLGLTIVRTLVEMHGGRVSAHSEGPGRGSEFVVRLPLLSGTPQHVSPASRSSGEALAASSRGAGVLVVDDNQDAADTLAEVLAENGYRTCVAYDGLQALQLAAEFQPQVALLDIGLPVMDGYELARRLRQDPRLTGIKLVAVTGYGQAVDRTRALAEGFDEHLVKPVELGTVEVVVRELSRR